MTVYRLPLALLLGIMVVIRPMPVQAQIVDNVGKTVCTLALGYVEIDEIKADLLTAAKREVVNELFGELIVASTAVENFVVTSDQIRASSIGFVRIDGNADFYNGDSFAEVCVTISAYVTEKDMAMFNPEPLRKKFCDSDNDMSTAQLISYVKDEVIIQALNEFDPKLRGADRDSLLELVQKVIYIDSGFIKDTQTYCAEFEGYVVRVEILALLDSMNNHMESSNSKQSLEQSQTVTYTLSFRGIDQNGYNTHDDYELRVNDGVPIAFDELTQAQANGERREDWEQYVFPVKLINGEENVIEISVTSGGSSHLGFDYLRLQKNETVIWEYGTEDFSGHEFFRSNAAYPVGDTVVSNVAERAIDVNVDSELVQQPTILFPGGIFGPGYSGARIVRIHFYMPN